MEDAHGGYSGEEDLRNHGQFHFFGPSSGIFIDTLPSESDQNEFGQFFNPGMNPENNDGVPFGDHGAFAFPRPAEMFQQFESMFRLFDEAFDGMGIGESVPSHRPQLPGKYYDFAVFWLLFC